jgi:hypothetical protein
MRAISTRRDGLRPMRPTIFFRADCTRILPVGRSRLRRRARVSSVIPTTHLRAHGKGCLPRSVGLVSLMDSVQVIASVLTTRGRSSDAARLIGGSEAALATRECPNRPYAQTVHDRTMTLLRESTSSAELDAWLAEGRAWSYEETIAAALAFEGRSGTSTLGWYG